MENKHESQAREADPQAQELTLKPLVLASTSPRRAEILRSVGWPFETLAVGIDETPLDSEDAAAYVERLAREKAEAVAQRTPDRIVLGADTTVVVEGMMLAKPADEDEAREMLKRLRGKWHEVLTGVALVRTGREANTLVSHQTTRVRFAEMTDAEIDWYVKTGEPMDKAGAYAIQGSAALFIEEVAGEYFNIVGLPVSLVYKLISNFKS
ncbi:MAG: septum formation inhibitor Maf [Acidobacteria bacterium]|nr:septum formation inhibitor Maf [Acidobacteriota bacterium]